MKTAEQLKGAIRNIAKDKNVRSQEVLQMFLFERILDRLAASSYKNNFILKGGLDWNFGTNDDGHGYNGPGY